MIEYREDLEAIKGTELANLFPLQTRRDMTNKILNLKDKEASSDTQQEGYYGDPKLPQDESVVKYISLSETEDQFCGNCIYYTDARNYSIGSCSLVKGEILNQGWCKLWTAITPVKSDSFFMFEGDSKPPTDEDGETPEARHKARRVKKVKDTKKTSESGKHRFATRSLEATPVDATGTEWHIRVIDAGTSLNNNTYPLDVLHRDSGVFEGVPVFAASGPDHSPAERGVRAQVGFIKSIENVPQGIDGTFHVSDESFRGILLDLYNEGVLDKMMGFSIVADGMWEANSLGGRTAIELTKGDSVDLVRDPAAGGKFLEVTESYESGDSHESNESHLEENAMVLEMTEDKLLEMMSKVVDEALKKAKESDDAAESKDDDDKKDGSEGNSDGGQSLESPVSESTVMSSAESRMTSILIHADISEAKLPNVSTQRIFSMFDGKPYDGKAVEAVINAEKDYIASLNKDHSEKVTETTGKVTVDAQDKRIARIDATFTETGMVKLDNGDKIMGYTTFKESYYEWTGISPYSITGQDLWKVFSGSINNYDSMDKEVINRRTHVTEASLTTSDWSNVVIDRLHNALLLNYNNLPQYQDWRKIVQIIPVTDFQPWRDTKVGGYADLPVVVESGTYPELTHPADEQTSATIVKHGGIAAQITREMIINDQIRAISQIPVELARAAARTLYKAVFDVLVDNATYGPDSVALFDGAHNNQGLTALSIAGLNELEILMRDQTKMGSTNDILGGANTPRLLLVPNNLRALAMRLSNPSGSIITRLDDDTDTDIDPEEYKGRLEVITLDYWSNDTDYFLVADPNMVAGIGVLFMNGNEEPELFVQRDETVGEAFTMDVQNIKIRHEWQTVLRDFRPFGFMNVA